MTVPTLKVSPVYLKNYQSKKRIIINRGGTSSTKTGSLLRLFVWWLKTGKVDDQVTMKSGILSIVRKYRANLDTSVQRDWEDILHEMGFYDYIEINKSSKTYKYGDRVVEFLGIDDPQKARGPRRKILYCNEANELAPEDFFQLQIRTEYKIFMDFNPDDDQVWIKTDLEDRRALEEGDVEVIVSTYKDNPFLSPIIVKEIERLSKVNPQYHKVYGLGEYGKLEGLVFPNFKIIDGIPNGAKLLGHGMDFGYTNHPTALVSLYWYDGGIILDERIYSTGLTNYDICEQMRILGIGKNEKIIADSAEPKSIAEISLAGYDIEGAEKGPDSVKFGIDLMLSFPMSLTSRSTNLKDKEFRKYTWGKDKQGNNTNIPVDAFNHGIDGARYATIKFLKKEEENNDTISFIW